MEQSLETTTLSRFSFFTKTYENLRFPYRSDKLFASVFFATLFVPLTQFPYLTDVTELPKLIMWILSAGIALWMIVRGAGEYKKFPRLFWYGLLVFVGLVIISTIFSVDTYYSLFGLQGRYTSSIIFFLLWAVWIYVNFQTLDSIKTLFLFKSLTAVGLLVAVYGIIQQQGIAYYEGLSIQARSLAPSFLGNPNFSSMFLAGALPLSVLLLYLTESKRARYFYGIAIFLMLWALMSFSSRGAILGFGVSVIILLSGAVYLRQRLKILAGLGVLIVVASALFYGFYLTSRPDSVTTTLNLQETTVNFRILAWNNALDLILHKPWSGYGPGNYFIGFKSLGDPTLASGERFDDGHNIILHLAVSLGIPAALVFLCIVGMVIFWGVKSFMKTNDLLVLSLLAGLLGLLTAMLFNPVTVGCWLLLAFLIGALLSTIHPTVPAKTAQYMKASFAVTAFIFILFGFFVFASNLSLYQAIVAYKLGKFEQSYAYSKLSRALVPFEQDAYQYEIASRIQLSMDVHETETMIGKLTALHPKSSDNLRRVKIMYMMLFNQTKDERYAQTVKEVMRQSEILEPRYAFLLSQNAYAYYKLSDYPPMFPGLAQSLVLNEKDFYNWILLARYYQLMNEKDQMLFALNKASTLSPEVFLIKQLIEDTKKTDDITKLGFPVRFPDITL